MILWFIAGAFFVYQNQHFGWNVKAKSDEEIVCDGITLILIALAVAG